MAEETEIAEPNFTVRPTRVSLVSQDEHTEADTEVINTGNQEPETVSENQDAENKPVEDSEGKHEDSEDPNKEESSKDVKPSDEDILSILKSKGIEVENIDEIVERLKSKPTSEEKKVAENEAEKERLGLFIEQGHTVDEYAEVKKTASIKGDELEVLGQDLFANYLKSKGLSDESIPRIMDEMFYRDLSEEGIEGNELKEVKILKQIGKENLVSLALTNVEKSKEILNSLTNALAERQKKVSDEKIRLAKIDKYFNEDLQIDRKLEIGKIDEKTVEPVGYKISSKDIGAVKAEVKSLSNYFFNSDGELDINRVEDILKAKYLESAVKTAYHEGATRILKEFQDKYPTDPFTIGVPTTVKGKDGDIVASKPRRVSLTAN